MARIDAGGMFRTKAIDKKFGVYNSITKVLSSTTVAFTGSKAGAGFIVENVTNVTIHAAGGGQLPGSTLLIDTLYPIGVNKVTIAATGVVYVLHK